MAAISTFVTFYPTDIDRVLHSPGGPVGRYANLYAREVAAEAQVLSLARLNQRTRRYTRGFEVKAERGAPGGGSRFLVLNSVVGTNPRRARSYASVLEKGSRPHIIRPRRRDGVLSFVVGGRRIVTQQVRHPGTRPYNILRDAEQVVRRRRLG